MSSQLSIGGRRAITRISDSVTYPTLISFKMARNRLTTKASNIARRLEAHYGSPDLGNKADPLDELIYIALTRQTTDKAAQRTWLALTSRYPSWEMLLDAPESEIAEVIVSGGFAQQKARWVKHTLRIIKERFGKLSLDSLRELDDAEAERFLCSLPGVNIKSAKCILMYSLNRQVLPVDTHVQRVSERLGLVERGLSSKQLHARLEDVVAPQWRFSFHVNAVVHGRTICRAVLPKCDVCLLKSSCEYYQKRD